jgi:hypothetical protein
MAITELKDDFLCRAEWRGAKAEQYPDDGRNKKAVVILGNLAATADAVPAGLMAEYAAVFLRWQTDEVVRLHNEALRAVGFHSEPETATAFVRDFIAMANADRRRFEAHPSLMTVI